MATREAPYHWVAHFLAMDFWLLALVILATRAATALHECLGHAAAAFVLGGKIKGIHISLFGGGRVWAELPHLGDFARFVFSWSGILVNLATGAATGLWAASRVKKGDRARTFDFFLAVFSLLSVLGSIFYAALGLYYGVGDPVSWKSVEAPGPAWSWALFATAIPVAAFFLFRTYLRLQDHLFSGEKPLARFVLAGLTLGAAIVGYGILFVGTGSALASLSAGREAFDREKTRLERDAREEIVARVRREHPDWSEERVRNYAEAIAIEVDPDKVPRRFPLAPVLAVLAFLGAGIAGRGKPLIYVETKSISTGAAFGWVLAAALVLALIYAVGGEFFP